MHFNPNHLHRTGSASTDLIHEVLDQNIQGGTPGEHYHLSAALYQHLINISNNPIYSEPVMTTGGEIMTTNSGDIVMQLMSASLIPRAADYVPPPITPAPLPDVVSPPVPTPAPAPAEVIAGVVKDPYWNNVTILCPLDSAIGVTAFPNLRGYASTVGFAGSDSPASAERPLFGKNTVKPKFTGSFASFFGSSTARLSVGGGAQCLFNGDFTVELHALNTSGTGIMLEIGGINTVMFRCETNGTGVFTLRSYGNDLAGSGTYVEFPFNITNNYQHIVIERKNSVIGLLIDGVPKAAVVFTGVLETIKATNNFFANVRITSGVARYNLTAFTPPTGPYPTA